MKLVSWNVNGIRACVQKGFLESFQKIDADVFCLQETKMQEGQLELELPGYYQYWNYAVKKGYSGTAVFTRKRPISVVNGIGIEEHDQEGRVITCEFEDFYFVTVYTPNSQDGLKRLEYRMRWEDDFRAYLKKLEKAKPVLKTLPGWKCDIRGIKTYEELPENCRKYIEFIEEQIGYPITMVSNGPGRDDIIYRKR